MSVVKIKRNDTRPLDVTLKANGVAVVVTGATIVFNMGPKIAGLGTIIDREPVTILDGVKGLVRYQWDVLDVEVSGVHRAEFEVTFGDGTIETFPNGEYLEIEIVSDLG